MLVIVGMRGFVHNLKGKMKIFFERYMVHFNATRAAEEAQYAHPNTAGPRLLKHPAVADAIENALAAMVMERDEVLRRLSSQAWAEHTDYYFVNEQGRVDIDMRGLMDAGLNHLIVGVKETEFGQEVKFTKALPALKLLGQHYKLFVTKIEHGVDPELEEILDEMDDETAVDL